MFINYRSGVSRLEQTARKSERVCATAPDVLIRVLEPRVPAAFHYLVPLKTVKLHDVHSALSSDDDRVRGKICQLKMPHDNVCGDNCLGLL